MSCSRWLVLSVLVLLGACSSSQQLTVGGEALPEMNRDARGVPLSMVVRVYQLKSDQAFRRLAIESLVAGRSERDLLGGELIRVHELMLLPGRQAVPLDEQLDEAARYIGVVGLYRQPDRNGWRLLFDADDIDGGGLSFRAAACHLEAVKPAPLLLPGQGKGVRVGCGVSGS